MRLQGLRLHHVFFVAVAAAFLAPSGAQAQFHDNGWIQQWLLYGPISRAGGANPSLDAIRSDYLTDGVEFFESTILPTVDTELEPDFFGAAPMAEGYHPILDIDADGFGEPAVFQEVDATTMGTAATDSIDLLWAYCAGGAPLPCGAASVIDNAMVYGIVYLKNDTGAALPVRIQLGSDDSAQVKLDDCEIFARSISRGWGAAEEAQDSIDVDLPTGGHRLMIKVFNGGGGFGFRLRLVDPTTGNPITSTTVPGFDVGLDPTVLGVEEPEPIGLAVSHSVTPDRLFGFEQAATVTLSALKTFPGLDDATAVTVTETLIPDTVLVDGSAEPAPSSTAGGVLTWELTVGDLVASGIKFDLRFTRPGSGATTGTFQVGAGSSCSSLVSGNTNLVAVALNALFLGDIVGGGNGTGTKPAPIGGVRLDQDGWLLSTALPAGTPENNNSLDTDAAPFQAIEAEGHPDFPELDLSSAAEFLDGTFFINTTVPIQINSGGVTYPFIAGDDNPNSWNHVLANVTHDTDKGVGNILVRNYPGSFATGVGVHASAGVTFDLDAMREIYGADKVVNIIGVIGTDTCGAPTVNNYIIYSTDTEVLQDYTSISLANSTAPPLEYRELIPPEARYITLATGDANDGIGCDHGVFAEMRITGELPEARFTATPDAGAAPLEVTFDASTSTSPAGSSIATYSWNFGDGTTGEGRTVAHTYTGRGTFTATLSVETDQFQTATASDQVVVDFACGDPAPFISADVGAPAVEGCARKDGDNMVVFGGGREILQRADQFQFTYREIEGDAVAIVRLDSLVLDNPNNGRVGVMFRNSLDPDSAFAFCNLSTSLTGLRGSLTRRTDTGVTATSSGSATMAPPNAWLKVERVGAEFIASTSTDGAAFVELARATLGAPAATMLVGMAVTAKDTLNMGLGAEATFADISIGSDEPPPTGVSFIRGDTNADGDVNISDASYLLNFLFLGGLDPACNATTDANGDGGGNISDASFILNFLFLGGSDIPPPNACDQEPRADEADCASYPRCP